MTSNFGNRLKEMRLHRGLSGVEVARMLHLDKSQISHYENSKHEPSLNTLVDLCKLYEVSVDYILIGEYTSRDFSEIENEMINNFRKVNDICKGRVLGILQNEIKKYD